MKFNPNESSQHNPNCSHWLPAHICACRARVGRESARGELWHDAAGDLFYRRSVFQNAVAGSNIYACVASNTWVIQATAALGGDLSGLPTSATVTQIQGHAVAPTAPAGGQALTWNTSTNRWEPQTISGGGGSLSGDDAAKHAG